MANISFEEMEEILWRMKEAREAIADTKKNIEDPGDKWQNIVKADNTPLYTTQEAYVAEEKKCLESYMDDLKCAIEELEDIKKEFTEYMGDDDYSWEEELEKYKKWHKENVEDMMCDETEIKRMEIMEKYKIVKYFDEKDQEEETNFCSEEDWMESVNAFHVILNSNDRMCGDAKLVGYKAMKNENVWAQEGKTDE